MFFHNLSHLVLYLSLLLPVAVLSQELPYRSYTTRDGLAAQSVRSLFQDSRGFIWMGTGNGLSRYDGVRFKNYSVANGLSNNWITDIAESPDKPGTLWIGTIAGGVNKIAGDNLTTIRVGRNNMANNVSSIATHPSGIVWFSANRNVYQVKNDSISTVHTPFQLKTGAVLVCGTDGAMWVAANESLFVQSFSTGRWATVSLEIRRQITLTAMGRCATGGVWIGTSDSLIHLVRESGIAQTLRSPFGTALRLVDDERGVLWVSSGSSCMTVETSPPFKKNVLKYPADIGNSPILVDRESNLWLGSWSKGVYKLSDKSLYRLAFGDQSNPALVQSASDSAGHIWIGARNGVWEAYRIGSMDWRRHFHALPRNSLVNVKFIDHLGRLWTTDKTEIIWQSHQIRHREGEHSFLGPGKTYIPSGTHKVGAVAFTVDSKGRAWGSIDSKGVRIFDPATGGSLCWLSKPDGVPDLSVRVIFEAKDRNIWLGGFYDGLSVFSTDSDVPRLIRKYTTEDGLPDNAIRSIHQDRDGILWVGTRHGGLARFKDGRFDVFSMKDGLLSNGIWDIVEDEQDRLWLRTDVGIESVSRTSLTLLRQNNEMLNDPAITLGIVPGKFLWFSTLFHLVIYEYPRATPDSVPPLVHISDFIVNGERMSRSDSVELAHDRNNCTIEFVGLSFKDERANRYQYRLQGVDSSWSIPTPQRAVTYATLNPGTYRFDVRAINADGVPSAHPASVAITIIPPFWQRWWFTTLIVAGIAALLYLFYRYRVARLLELERLRMRIASDLHDDVGTNLSSIMLTSQIMERKFPHSQEALSQLTQLRTTAGKAQEMLKDIVWLLSPRNDSFDDFVLKLKEIGTRLLVEIPFTLTVSGGQSLDKLNLDVKRNIVLFFKEALNNVAKHAHATEVHSDIIIDGQDILVSIRDNGTGFDPASSRSGNGLLNLEQRARNLGGTMRLSSIAGRGTTVELRANITHMRSGKIKTAWVP